jgi:SAM-dependent methyltransferase
MTNAGNTAVNRYGSIATEIYDLDKPPGALPDTAFYLARLAGLSGEILEPACGSGRTLVPLLQAGRRVAGFDPSEDMLERCRARCSAIGAAPDLTAQRLETFRYERRFAAIILPLGSFTLIDDVDVAISVLRGFHTHLDPGGRLIVDLPSLAFLSAAADDRRCWTAANGDLLTLEGKRLATDWIAQRAQSMLRYERWRGNVLIETQMEPMAQRFWGMREFTLALAATGFTDIIVTGDHRPGAPVRASSRTLTFEAVKAG